MSSYPTHLKHFDYRGVHRYSLTFCTDQRQKHFVAAAPIDRVCTQILRAATQQHFDVVAYCFMPDHLHLLVTGAQDNADLKAFVARAKQFSGFHWSKHADTRLWQRYGYERTLRGEEGTEETVRYLIANPIRAGLATNVNDYAWWGSSLYSREELLDFVQWAG
jgi:putative transposase